MTILSTLKELAKSKKALAALIGVACWVGGRFGLDMSPSDLTQAVTPIWLYIIGTALQDFGKEAKKIEVAAAPGEASSEK